MKVIDTHAHFWDIKKFQYPWIENGSFFSRNFLLEDYQRVTANVPVEKIIFVECNCRPELSVEEADWVAHYSKVDARIKGIVAHVSLTEKYKLDANLEKMTARPLVKGIRHNIQFEAPGFATADVFVKGVKKVHQKGFHFELCITHDQLDETIELVKKCPEVFFILDHCAKPGIKGGVKEPWMTQMGDIARFENVVCKISGLLTEADPAKWTQDEVLFYANHAAQVFGPSRIMFGSDWPVSELAGGYLAWYDLTRTLTRSWNRTEQENFYYNNAEKFYRL
jgi:L-fuconolactonase